MINQSIGGSVERSSPGDGGDVAIDDTSIPGHSIRYISAQSLGSFRRQVYDAKNNLISEDLLTPNIIGNFVTPVVLNANNPSRIAIGGAFGIFESFDRGDSFREIFGPESVSFGVIGIAQMALEYGGYRNGTANPAVLYVGSDGEVFVRTQQTENLRLTRAQFPGGFVRDIGFDTADWANAYVIDRDDVYVTSNTGDSWKKVTGNLHTAGGGRTEVGRVRPQGLGRGLRRRGHRTRVRSSRRTATPGNGRKWATCPTRRSSTWSTTPRTTCWPSARWAVVHFCCGMPSTASAAAGGGETQQSSARGVVWKDLDGDGVQDGNEPGLAGVTVYVDTNGDNQFGVSEPAAVSAANGSFVIGNVPGGTFAVRALDSARLGTNLTGRQRRIRGRTSRSNCRSPTSISAFAKEAAEKWDSISVTLPDRSRRCCPAMAHRTASCPVSNWVS